MPYLEKFVPLRKSSGIVVVPAPGKGIASCQPSKLTNRKSLSLRIGPPKMPPNWLTSCRPLRLAGEVRLEVIGVEHAVAEILEHIAVPVVGSGL